VASGTVRFLESRSYTVTGHCIFLSSIDSIFTIEVLELSLVFINLLGKKVKSFLEERL